MAKSGEVCEAKSSAIIYLADVIFSFSGITGAERSK
jgi:hypothetical protein